MILIVFLEDTSKQSIRIQSRIIKYVPCRSKLKKQKWKNCLDYARNPLQNPTYTFLILTDSTYDSGYTK